MATIKLLTGAKYFAGFSRPFFVTDGMVRSHLERLGATNIQFHNRESAPPVNPSTDPTATDKWDEWISAEYHGPNKTITEPRRWAWAVRRLGATAAPSTPNAPKPQDASAVESDAFAWGLIGAAAVLLLAALRGRR